MNTFDLMIPDLKRRHKFSKLTKTSMPIKAFN
jgi:hypothetical protein